MNKKGLKVLEYNKIIELLSSQAGSEMAKEKLNTLTPSDNAAEIREYLAETTEAVSVIVRKGSLPSELLNSPYLCNILRWLYPYKWKPLGQLPAYRKCLQ